MGFVLFLFFSRLNEGCESIQSFIFSESLRATGRVFFQANDGLSWRLFDLIEVPFGSSLWSVEALVAAPLL